MILKTPTAVRFSLGAVVADRNLGMVRVIKLAAVRKGENYYEVESVTDEHVYVSPETPVPPVPISPPAPRGFWRRLLRRK